MIENERQYRISKAQVGKFERALEQSERASGHDEKVHPALRRAQQEGIRSQLEDLRKEVAAYETLKSAATKEIPFDSVGELARMIITARVARGWSQKMLGERLNLKEQQIQRYEKSKYRSASLRRLGEVCEVLGLQVKGLSVLLDEKRGSRKGTRKGKEMDRLRLRLRQQRQDLKVGRSV